MSVSWFVVQTHPNGEDKAVRNLVNQGFDVYLPKYAKERRHARKVEMVLRPLFPRYLFVNFDPNTDQWRPINGTIGVSRLMTQGERPLPLAIGVVEEIKDRENNNGIVTLAPQRFSVGQQLRLCRGALLDHVGAFQEMADGNRVVLLLNLLGRDVRIKAPVDFLAAAS